MQFTKYHGTGNDFILIDDRAGHFPTGDYGRVAALCHRRFGIGADGLILLQESLSPANAFTMVYYNSDGKPGSFCGNGGRCAVAFASELGMLQPGRHIRFSAADGVHEADYHTPQKIELQMRAAGDPVAALLPDGSTGYYLNTGSPHLIVPVSDVDKVEVETLGRALRYDPQFAPYGGVNVNFVEILSSTSVKVRTYERGVEAETYSCGTGVTAAALWHSPGNEVSIQTPGGMLSVRSSENGGSLYLIGPAERVFAGTI